MTVYVNYFTNSDFTTFVLLWFGMLALNIPQKHIMMISQSQWNFFGKNTKRNKFKTRYTGKNVIA